MILDGQNLVDRTVGSVVDRTVGSVVDLVKVVLVVDLVRVALVVDLVVKEDLAVQTLEGKVVVEVTVLDVQEERISDALAVILEDRVVVVTTLVEDPAATLVEDPVVIPSVDAQLRVKVNLEFVLQLVLVDLVLVDLVLVEGVAQPSPKPAALVLVKGRARLAPLAKLLSLLQILLRF